MSYILDALKKAESERKLGGVPNIHAQPPASILTPHQPSWRKPALWAGILALAMAGGGLAWWQTSARQAPPPAQVVQTAPPAAPASQAPQVAAAPVATEQPVAKSEPPAAKPATIPSEPQEAPEAPKPAKPVKRAKPAEAEQKAVAKAAPKPEQRVAKAEKAEKPAPEPAAPKEERIASLRELPDHIQREIPPLVINGYIYSPNKADRTVLVNGKLVREGDQVAPDLAVERLTQGGMVLNYKGYRYRSPY
ncbi:general secretion pathway protein GspB [Noviherbaspirillum sp.]|uniref:general secretion pathway protein GspB n=1 Tax=Noviherbaspirillum sp. TaxID=1926288 RepID=UPI002FE06563